MFILSDLEFPALPYIEPIAAISNCHNIDYIMAQNSPVILREGDLLHIKVCKDVPLGYAETSPLTLCNHYMHLYRVLDTLFLEYYQLMVVGNP